MPEPQQYLLPRMNLASVIGWKEGETPTVAEGLKIEALADLRHPRLLYVLPNGDILVVESKSPAVEPVKRPKDLIMGWVEPIVIGGGDSGPSNRTTLLRDSDRKPEERSVVREHLHSPFGMVLVGGNLYVANTDSLMRYPYTTGDASSGQRSSERALL